MRKWLTWTFIAIVLAGVAVGSWFWWRLQDEDWLRRQAVAAVSRATGWELGIHGRLHLLVGRETVLQAEAISLDNPQAGVDRLLATVGSLQVRFLPWSLLDGPLEIRQISLQDCELRFIQDASDRWNWSLPAVRSPGAQPAERPPDWRPPVLVRSLDVHRCEVQRRKQSGDLVVFEIPHAGLRVESLQRLQVDIDGMVDRQALQLSGHLGPLTSFWSGEELEHDLKGSLGPIMLESQGRVEHLRTGSGVQLDLHFSGPKIEQLSHYLALPQVGTGPFDLQLALQQVAQDARSDQETPGKRVGTVTQLSLSGDLGDLQIHAQGSLDRLVRPQHGTVTLATGGPDLRAFVAALGAGGRAAGLPAQPFSLGLDVEISEAVTTFHQASLDVAGNRLDLSGSLGPPPLRNGSDLELSAELAQFDDWDVAALLGVSRRMPLAGPGTLDLGLHVDAAGQGILEIELHALDSRVKAETAPATWGEWPAWFTRTRLEADTPNLADWRDTVNNPKLPARPLQARGLLRWQDAHWSLALDQAQSGGLSFTGEIQPTPGAGDPGQGDTRSGDPGLTVSGNLQAESLAELWPKAPAVLAGLPGRAQGKVSMANGSLRFESLTGQLGEMDWQLEGVWSTRRRTSSSGQPSAESRELQLKLHTVDVAGVGDLLGASLPNGSMHFEGSLKSDGQAWRLDELQLKLPGNDVSGTIEYLAGESPRVTAALHSSSVDLRHWLPAHDESVAAKPGATAQSGRLIPDRPLPRLPELPFELDVDWRAEKLLHSSFSWIDVDASILWRQDRVEIQPLTFSGLAGGDVQLGAVWLQQGDGADIRVELLGSQLRPSEIGESVNSAQKLAPFDLELFLHGQGASTAELAAGLRGELEVLMGGGEFSTTRWRWLNADLVAQVLQTLNPLAGRKKVTRLDCAAAVIDIRDGLVEFNPAVLVTEDMASFMAGSLDLGTERLDLQFRTVPRKGVGISASSAINPFFKLGGSLARPMVELDKTRGAIAGGTAFLTSGLSILVKGLADRFLSSKDPCADARANLLRHAVGTIR